jgi:hypothetical protein
MHLCTSVSEEGSTVRVRSQNRHFCCHTHLMNEVRNDINLDMLI